MKIVFILPQEATHPIGGFKVVYEYANGLVNRGHHVHIVHLALTTPKFMSRQIKEKLRIVRYFRFALRGNWKPDKWFSLDPAVEITWIPWLSKAFMPEADAYVATWWVTAEHLNAIRGLSGRKFYLIQHLETWGGPEEAVMATWKMPLEKIVISRWLRAIGSSLGEECHYIPNGLDFTRFGCDVSPELRHASHIAMPFYGMHGWKGSADGLAAVYELKKKHPDLKVELFGVYEPPEDLPAWIVYHQNVVQEELRRIYNRAAILLAPSHSEGWGLPPSEAMMCGAAVVATDIGGHQEFCRQNETALLVPPKNPGELAEAAGMLIDNQDLRIRIAKRGRDNIQRFTWQAATDAFEKVLSGRAEPESRSIELSCAQEIHTP
jgi:glycosyltransferase involved in cell wall biosynthesis